MKKNITIVLLVTLISSLYVDAQFDAGLRIGTFISTMQYTGAVETLSDFKTTAVHEQLGLIGEYHIDPNWSVELGVHHTVRSADLGTSSSVNVFGLSVPIGIDTRFRSRSIDIPLQIKYYYGQNNTQPYAKIGSGISLTQSAQIIPRATALLTFNLPKIDIPTSDLNELTGYATAGIGISHKVGQGKLFGEVSYLHSFDSIMPETIVDLSIKNNGYSVGIGYAMSF